MEKGWELYLGQDIYDFGSTPDGIIPAAVINAGVGEIVDAAQTGNSGTLPPPTVDPQVEIVAPFWENTGNYIDLSNPTQTTFAAMFGEAIEGSDFNSTFTVDKAALVNTSDAGNRIQIQNTSACTNAYLSGNRRKWQCR